MAEENGHDRNSKGLFLPGNKASSNRGPNKVSTKVRDSLVKFLEDNIDAVQESFDKLKPIEKLQFVANILPYVVPKLSSIESEANVKHAGGITIKWEEPDIQAGQNKGSVSYLQSLQAGSEDNNQPRGDQIDQDV